MYHGSHAMRSHGGCASHRRRREPVFKLDCADAGHETRRARGVDAIPAWDGAYRRLDVGGRAAIVAAGQVGSEQKLITYLTQCKTIRQAHVYLRNVTDGRRTQTARTLASYLVPLPPRVDKESRNTLVRIDIIPAVVFSCRESRSLLNAHVVAGILVAVSRSPRDNSLVSLASHEHPTDTIGGSTAATRYQHLPSLAYSLMDQQPIPYTGVFQQTRELMR